jgi:hypothetical protein
MTQGRKAANDANDAKDAKDNVSSINYDNMNELPDEEYKELIRKSLTCNNSIYD